MQKVFFNESHSPLARFVLCTHGYSARAHINEHLALLLSRHAWQLLALLLHEFEEVIAHFLVANQKELCVSACGVLSDSEACEMQMRDEAVVPRPDQTRPLFVVRFKWANVFDEPSLNSRLNSSLNSRR